MSMKRHAHQIPHSLSLGGILLVTFLGMVIFSFDRMFQSAVVVSGGVAYVVWGIVHHSLHKDLTPIVVLEYITVAALGVTVLLSMIYRS